MDETPELVADRSDSQQKRQAGLTRQDELREPRNQRAVDLSGDSLCLHPSDEPTLWIRSRQVYVFPMLSIPSGRKSPTRFFSRTYDDVTEADSSTLPWTTTSHTMAPMRKVMGLFWAFLLPISLTISWRFDQKLWIIELAWRFVISCRFSTIYLVNHFAPRNSQQIALKSPLV